MMGSFGLIHIHTYVNINKHTSLFGSLVCIVVLYCTYVLVHLYESTVLCVERLVIIIYVGIVCDVTLSKMKHV